MELESVLLLGSLAFFVGVLIGSVGIGGVLLVPILTYIFKIERGEEVEYPQFDIPEDMSFDEYGKKVK